MLWWSERGECSPGPDGERVGVVGQDRPLSRVLPSLVSLEAGSLQPVAALEVADAALHTTISIAPAKTPWLSLCCPSPLTACHRNANHAQLSCDAVLGRGQHQTRVMPVGTP